MVKSRFCGGKKQKSLETQDPPLTAMKYAKRTAKNKTINERRRARVDFIKRFFESSITSERFWGWRDGGV